MVWLDDAGVKAGAGAAAAAPRVTGRRAPAGAVRTAARCAGEARACTCSAAGTSLASVAFCAAVAVRPLLDREYKTD